MADAQDLHQIEYRHHQTKDLSPVASSMSSAESLRAWDSRIRAWVRHPHADRLSESVCYQLLRNGQAALAWRYWDRRAAERADGTRGRPLVSRVLVGPAGVLTPEIAVALCQAGPTADSVGPMPGEVPDGAELPTVSAAALVAVTRAMIPVLDQDAAQQAGLQAVVAAALADPYTALAISVQDTIIQKPLREGVQGPLLWGLGRIASPLLGPAGRDWSFSTFEPPLGEMDPASLPGIVFRQAQDGAQTPPTRWRKEVRVRPLASNALDPGSPYAEQVELAGWLVAEYRERGGDWLGQFVAECCGSERSLQVRLDRVYDELRKIESPMIISGEPTGFVSLSAGSPPAPEEPESAGSDLEKSGRDVAGTEEGSRAVADEPGPSAPWDPDREAREIASPAADGADEEVARSGSRPAESLESQEPQSPTSPAEQTVASPPFGPDQYETAVPPERPPGFASPDAEPVVGGSDNPVYYEDQEPPRGRSQFSARTERWKESLAPSREGQTAPQLPVPGRSRHHADAPSAAQPADRYQPPPQPVAVSHLLKQLELVGDDAGRFDSILRGISQVGGQLAGPNDRLKSWEVISHNDWYANIRKHHLFGVAELIEIFGIVVIPDLVGPDAAEVIARWAYDAPPPMVGGLLGAARRASPETWRATIRILESVLAARWAADNSIQDQWDASRATWSAGEFGRGENKRGILGHLRRH
jgi:hypothetical protein